MVIQAIADNFPERFEEIIKETSKNKAKEDVIGMKKRIFSATNDKGRNLLHIAAFFCAEKIVDILCTEFKQLQLSVDSKDNFGYTPAILACIHKSETDSLISHVKSGNTSSPASPSNKKSPESVKFQEKKLDLHLRRNILRKIDEQSMAWRNQDYSNQYNPLHWAIANGDEFLVTFIVERKPDFRKLWL